MSGYYRVGEEETPKAKYEYFQTAPKDDNDDEDLGEVIVIVTDKATGNKHLMGKK